MAAIGDLLLGENTEVIDCLLGCLLFRDFHDKVLFALPITSPCQPPIITSHYIQLQTQCSNCIPPTYGLPATFYFGASSTPLVIDAIGDEVNNQLQKFFNDEHAFEKAFMTSKSHVIGQFTNESDHLDQQLETVVDEMIDADLNNMTLKTVIIITNYFSPSSYSIIERLNKAYMSFSVQSFTITDFELQTNLTKVLTVTSNETILGENSELLLNSSIDSPYSCEAQLCKVGLFFELFYNNFSYIGRFLDHKFMDPDILFLNTAEHMSLNIFVMGLIHVGCENITIFATSPWMGTNDTLAYLKAQVYDWAHAQTPINYTYFYKMESDYILGSHAGFNVANTSYVAMIADATPLEFLNKLKESPSRPVSTSHYVDLILLDTYRVDLTPRQIYKYVTEAFLVLPTTVSKRVGNHVIAINKTIAFEWVEEYGVMSSVAASAPLGPATHPSHIVTIVCSIVGGLLGIVLVGLVIFLWNKRRKRRQAIKHVQEMKTEECAPMDGFRISVKDIEVRYEDVLGKGVTSVVYRALLKTMAPVHKMLNLTTTSKFTNCSAAIKMPTEFNYTEMVIACKELEAYRRLKYHEHIIPCLGWVQIETRKCMVFELAEGGDLRHYVMAMRSRPKEEFDEREFLHIFRQICQGMTYVAQCKMVHRDLAARNVLLTADKRAKISDFGLCCDCDETFTYTATLSKRLPIRWLSLEALVDRVFSEKSDVWSFGVLLYEVFSKGVTPYAALSNAEIVDFLSAGERLERPPFASDDVAEVMRSCWEEDVSRRPSFDQLSKTLETMLEKGAEHYGYLIA